MRLKRRKTDPAAARRPADQPRDKVRTLAEVAAACEQSRRRRARPSSRRTAPSIFFTSVMSAILKQPASSATCWSSP